MFEFLYHIRFYTHHDLFNVRIYASLDDHITPVYISSYDQAVLTNKDEFSFVYHEIRDYFEQKHVKINKDDLRLFYYTLSQFNMSLPVIQSILVEEVDNHLSQLTSLTPKEMLFLMYIDGKSVEGKKAHYWFEEYQVDVEFMTQILEGRGYLTTQDYLYNLEHATRIELEDILKLNKCPTTGSRQEIINRLKNELSENALKKFFSGLYISLTPNGRKVIQNLTILSEFHKSHYRLTNKLSINEFYLLHLMKPHYNTTDICKMLIVNQNADQLGSFEWQDLFNEPKQKAYSPFVIEDDFENILTKYHDDFDEVVEVEEDLIDDFNESTDVVETNNQIDKLKQKHQKASFIEAHMLENQANIERLEIKQDPQNTELLLKDILKDSELIEPLENNQTNKQETIGLDEFYKIISKFSQPKEDPEESELSNLNTRMKLNNDDFFEIINKETNEAANLRLVKNEAVLAEAIEEVTSYSRHKLEQNKNEATDHLQADILEDQDLLDDQELDILIENTKKYRIFKRLFSIEFMLSSVISMLILYCLYYFVF
jgi:hypothetical protein